MKSPLVALEPSRSAGRAAAQVVDITAYLAGLPQPGSESQAEAVWSDLLRRALDLWNWRDPSSVDDLEAVVAAVRAVVRSDWGA